MADRTYWLNLYTGPTWQAFLDGGATVSGFRESRWSTVQKIKVGDYLLCYLTGVSRWIGVAEVQSEGYLDRSPLPGLEDFPARLKVKVVIALTPETAVPVHSMRDQLSMFRDIKHPSAWTGRFRGSPGKWDPKDADVVIKALESAKASPVERPLNRKQLSPRPAPMDTKIGAVTIPEPDGEGHSVGAATPNSDLAESEGTVHTEIQHMLLQLGSDMGLDVWVARNDRGRVSKGQAISSIPRLKTDLPVQFDQATTKTIELIDVLWLKGNAIVAAFEIESTTSIYSGLLRMADLIAMQPNLNLSLFLVAPDERRNKVITEINRPTFSRLSPPMVEMCRFISFSTLRAKVLEMAQFVRYLKPDVLDELAETCETGQ